MKQSVRPTDCISLYWKVYIFASGDVMTEEGFQNFPAEWFIELQSHRKALDPDSTLMIKELFDGAETVHLKVSPCQGFRTRFTTEVVGRFSTRMVTCSTTTAMGGISTELHP